MVARKDDVNNENSEETAEKTMNQDQNSDGVDFRVANKLVLMLTFRY